MNVRAEPEAQRPSLYVVLHEHFRLERSTDQDGWEVLDDMLVNLRLFLIDVLVDMGAGDRSVAFDAMRKIAFDLPMNVQRSAANKARR